MVVPLLQPFDDRRARYSPAPACGTRIRAPRAARRAIKAERALPRQVETDEWTLL